MGKKKIKKPIVAIGGVNNKNYKKLIRNGAKYIAISSFIWDNPKLKPEIAIKKIQMKITANEIKTGMIIEHKNDFWNVLKTQHVKPGKGGAFIQVELKSVIKSTKLNERFRSNETIEKAEVDEKNLNFLYTDGENCHFMDSQSFEQVEISKSIIGEKHKLLKENIKVTISFMEEKPISVELPNNIECVIESTDAAIKNQTASSSYKPALLDCGIKINVPPFIESGEKIIIDTRTLEYVRRIS